MPITIPPLSLPFGRKDLSDDEDGLDVLDLGLDDVDLDIDDVDEFGDEEEEKGNETVRANLPVITEQIRQKVEQMSKPIQKAFNHVEAKNTNVNMPYASLTRTKFNLYKNQISLQILRYTINNKYQCHDLSHDSEQILRHILPRTQVSSVSPSQMRYSYASFQSVALVEFTITTDALLQPTYSIVYSVSYATYAITSPANRWRNGQAQQICHEG